jgi:hypothetical protein
MDRVQLVRCRGSRWRKAGKFIRQRWIESHVGRRKAITHAPNLARWSYADLGHGYHSQTFSAACRCYAPYYLSIITM